MMHCYLENRLAVAPKAVRIYQPLLLPVAAAHKWLGHRAVSETASLLPLAVMPGNNSKTQESSQRIHT
jgi:hypothetical protein